MDRREKKSEKDAMFDFVKDLPKNENGLNTSGAENVGATSTDYDKKLGELDLAYNKLKQLDLFGMSNGEEEYTGQGVSDKEYEGLLASAMSEFVVALPKKQNGLDAFRIKNAGAASTDYDREFDERDLAYNKLKQMKLSGMSNGEEEYTGQGFNDKEYEGLLAKKLTDEIHICSQAHTLSYPRENRIYYHYNHFTVLTTHKIFQLDLLQITLLFPEWLQRNRPTLSAAEYNMRVKQFELLKSMCSQYEKEDSNDSDEVKTERFKILMYLMHKVRCCGGPPIDLLEGIKLSPF